MSGLGEGVRFDGVVLAGGKSTRFGSDKAFATWGGVPLFTHQLRTLAALEPDKLWLSVRQDQPFPEVLVGVEKVVDEISDVGPVSGLLSSLRASEADYLLVLGVDLPQITPRLLERLIDLGGGSVYRNERFWEPLVALYPRAAMLTLIEEAVGDGTHRLQDICDRAIAEGIIAQLEISESERAFFFNANTREELESVSPSQAEASVVVRRYRDAEEIAGRQDWVAREEPLELRVNGESVAVMMRTPGHDEELAAGFLLTEGLLTRREEILEIVPGFGLKAEEAGNVIDVRLDSEVDLSSLTRHVYTSSSCGVCGKTTVESVMRPFPPISKSSKISPEVIVTLPDKLRQAQDTFERTGGLHASAVFSEAGELQLVREDVGRHNALDKVIGRRFLDQQQDTVCLLVSGRISFELMQKALVARIPLVAGISAPSSLAVDLAQASGQTLVGFLRGESFNVYAGTVCRN
ncbi:MAG: formate dehydrogenase accessory sulfurtransferase FdhD [Verrucomicrobiota bacterium]